MLGPYTPTEFAAIWSGSIRARAFGTAQWVQVNRTQRAYLLVEGQGFAAGDLEVCMRIHGKRPNEITVLLLVRAAPAVHLDVNQAHRQQGDLHEGTHLQWDSGRGLGFRMEPGAPPVPLSGNVPPAAYRETLGYFLDLLHIAADDVQWTDPPIGGAR